MRTFWIQKSWLPPLPVMSNPVKCWMHLPSSIFYLLLQPRQFIILLETFTHTELTTFKFWAMLWVCFIFYSVFSAIPKWPHLTVLDGVIDNITFYPCLYWLYIRAYSIHNVKKLSLYERQPVIFYSYDPFRITHCVHTLAFKDSHKAGHEGIMNPKRTSAVLQTSVPVYVQTTSWYVHKIFAPLNAQVHSLSEIFFFPFYWIFYWIF